MIEADLHSHTFFSCCGIHTHIELLTRAKEMGMKVLAITDHGTAVGGKIPSTFFDRLQDPLVSGIKLLKGIECNFIDEEGTLDLPPRAKYLDIILAGFHKNMRANADKEYYTTILLKSLQKNRCIDIITHPNDPKFPLDYKKVALKAKEYGVALELNNSKVRHKRIPDNYTRELLQVCMETEAKVAVNSDTHAMNELGDDSFIRKLMRECHFPEEQVVNSTAEKALAFVEARKKFKQEL